MIAGHSFALLMLGRPEHYYLLPSARVAQPLKQVVDAGNTAALRKA